MHIFFSKFGSPLSWAGIVTFLHWDHSAIKLIPPKPPILRLGEKLSETLFLKNSNNMCSVKQQGWPQCFPAKRSDLYVAKHFHQHFGDKVLGMSLTSELHKLQTWNVFGCLPLRCSWDSFQEFQHTPSSLAHCELGMLSEVWAGNMSKISCLLLGCHLWSIDPEFLKSLWSCCPPDPVTAYNVPYH